MRCNSDQVKEDEMGRACGTHGGEEECIQGFGGKARRKEINRKRIIPQEVLGRTNRLRSFDTIRTAWKTKKLRSIHRQTAW
jgi:hypothetical protein